LLEILAPDVVALNDGGGVKHALPRPIVGADRVARLFAVYWNSIGAVATLQPTQVNGYPALIVRLNGELDSVMAVRIDDGRISSTVWTSSTSSGPRWIATLRVGEGQAHLRQSELRRRRHRAILPRIRRATHASPDEECRLHEVVAEIDIDRGAVGALVTAAVAAAADLPSTARGPHAASRRGRRAAQH
jgi:hypothetical protein